MSESIQHVLDRVRSPRVQITYDVEIGDAIQMKELPFVVGVMADLSGHAKDPLPKVKDRKFVEIDRDNFNGIMTSIAPRLAFQVPNKLTDDNTSINVELNFETMDDFNPISVVEQVKPLKELYEARCKLRDMLSKLDGNDELDALLKDVLESTDKQAALKKEAEARAKAAAEEKA